MIHPKQPDVELKARVLFLPGGQWQVPVIARLRDLGHFVICADGTENAPGFSIANESHRITLQDIDALVQIGRSARVDAVMTDQTDFAVPIVARVANRLQLPGLPLDVADAATNKERMRRRAAAGAVRQPQFHVCRTGDDVRQAVRQLGLPLFHKPVDGQSSRGVGVLAENSPAAVDAALTRSLEASKSKAAIFEQLIRGTECTVEGFVIDGCPHTLAVSDKSHYPDLPGVARTLTYPADLPPATLTKLDLEHQKAVRAIGIPFGVTHSEFIVDVYGNPWLVELAARGGGSHITSRIVPAVSGFDPIEAQIRTLLGLDVRVPSHSRRAAQLRFLRLRAGTAAPLVRNLTDLRSREGVLELMFNVGAGQIVPNVTDDRSRHGLLITTGPTRSDAVQLADSIEHALDLESEI